MSAPEDQIAFLPSDDEPLTAEEELAEVERALDEGPDADDLIVAEDDRPPIGASWSFDFDRGRFRTGGGRGPLGTVQIDTLTGWIEKCLHTDRGAHPIHPPEYGLEAPYAMIGEPVATAGIDLEPRIREALTFHPRIVDVTDFEREVDLDNERLFMRFTVVLDDETQLPVEVQR